MTPFYDEWAEFKKKQEEEENKKARMKLFVLETEKHLGIIIQIGNDFKNNKIQINEDYIKLIDESINDIDDCFKMQKELLRKDKTLIYTGMILENVLLHLDRINTVRDSYKDYFSFFRKASELIKNDLEDAFEAYCLMKALNKYANKKRNCIMSRMHEWLYENNHNELSQIITDLKIIDNAIYNKGVEYCGPDGCQH